MMEISIKKTAHPGKLPPAGKADGGRRVLHVDMRLHERAGQLRTEGTADAQRDLRPLDRGDGVFVQHLHADLRERLQLVIAQLRDRSGI